MEQPHEVPRRAVFIPIQLRGPELDTVHAAQHVTPLVLTLGQVARKMERRHPHFGPRLLGSMQALRVQRDQDDGEVAGVSWEDLTYRRIIASWVGSRCETLRGVLGGERRQLGLRSLGRGIGHQAVEQVTGFGETAADAVERPEVTDQHAACASRHSLSIAP